MAGVSVVLEGSDMKKERDGKVFILKSFVFSIQYL